MTESTSVTPPPSKPQVKSQPLSTQPYKGTRDFYPEDFRIQKWIFDRLRDAVSRFGYEEYDGPMLEPFELYAAKSGEELVNQQLYWLIDRGERKLAVRPEMTPTMARMVAGKFHELPRPIRWFSFPNLWRYERPQRGRLREHWQLNVDVLGGDAQMADTEILQVALECVKAFGGEKFVQVRVNHRELMDHFFGQVLGLKAEQALALTKAIDARAKIGEEAYAKWLGEIGVSEEVRGKLERFFAAPLEKIAKEYPCEGAQKLLQLMDWIAESGFRDQVVFDPMIMRGLDYYTGTVFEIFDVSPDNRRALFGGGRYDNLVGLFGNFKLSGVGFGMGDVGLRNFLETHQLLPTLESPRDVFIGIPDLKVRPVAEKLAGKLRAQGVSVVTSLEVSGFGAQLKLASKLKARFAVLLGEAELERGVVILKNLSQGTQEEVSLEEVDQIVQRVR